MKKYRTALVLTTVLCLSMCIMGCSSPEKQAVSKYPQKAIQLVVPYAPGGATDIIYRLVADHLKAELGQSVAVVNMSGASATTGSRFVKDAKPDGYTLLGSHDVIATAFFSGVVDYAFEAFEPVCLLTSTPNIATTNAKNPWNTVTELLEAAKKKPGEIVWSVTLGSTDHYFTLGMLHAAKLDQDILRLTGYDGTGPQITALLGGHTQGCMSNVASAASYVDAKELKFIGVAHDSRLPQCKDVPTLKEQGIDFTHGTNRGVFVPKNTPPEIITKLEKAFKSVMDKPEVVKKISEMGTLVNFKSTADYKVFLDDTMKTYRTLTDLLDTKTK